MRPLGKIAAVQAIVFLCGLVAIECALAWFAPLPPHGGVYTDRNGKPARVSRDDVTLVPNLDLVHSASEFSAGIHTDAAYAVAWQFIADEVRQRGETTENAVVSPR